MAETVGLPRGYRSPIGVFGGLFAALKRGFSLAVRGRSATLRPEEWPDYLLRDIGLDRTGHDADPRAAQTDWLMR